jgi:hypothetical protein
MTTRTCDLSDHMRITRTGEVRRLDQVRGRALALLPIVGGHGHQTGGRKGLEVWLHPVAAEGAQLATASASGSLAQAHGSFRGHFESAGISRARSSAVFARFLALSFSIGQKKPMILPQVWMAPLEALNSDPRAL